MARARGGAILRRMANQCYDCGLAVPKLESDGKSTVPYGWHLSPPTKGAARWYCPACWAKTKERKPLI